MFPSKGRNGRLPSRPPPSPPVYLLFSGRDVPNIVSSYSPFSETGALPGAPVFLCLNWTGFSENTFTLLILHNCEPILFGYVAVYPPEDDDGNHSVQEIRHGLRPDQAGQSPDQVHPDHDRDNQYNVADQREQEYLCHKRHPDWRSDQDRVWEPGPYDRRVHPRRIWPCDAGHEAGFSRPDAAPDWFLQLKGY